MTQKIETAVLAIRVAAMRELLTTLTAGETPIDVGRRAILVDFILNQKRGKQSAIAKKMGVSRARVSQMVKRLRRELATPRHID